MKINSSKTTTEPRGLLETQVYIRLLFVVVKASSIYLPSLSWTYHDLPLQLPRRRSEEEEEEEEREDERCRSSWCSCSTCSPPVVLSIFTRHRAPARTSSAIYPGYIASVRARVLETSRPPDRPPAADYFRGRRRGSGVALRRP